MTFPRILVIGSNGQVGWELVRTLAPLGEVVAVDYPEIDLSSRESMRGWILKTRPQVIVNAAAYTAVDKAESEPDVCRAVNSTAPGVLATEAKAIGAVMVHYSTEYIFDGRKTTPYLEADAANPLGVYGQSKLAGDEAVRQATDDHLIFRLSWVYGARGRNFLLTMWKLAQERDTLQVVSDQHGCPTGARMIAETTAHALAQTLRAKDRSPLWGTYHLSTTHPTTWHQFAQSIINAVPETSRKCTHVQAIPTSEYPTPTQRPAYSVMDCGKLENTFGVRMPEWSECLKLVLEQML